MITGRDKLRLLIDQLLTELARKPTSYDRGVAYLREAAKHAALPVSDREYLQSLMEVLAILLEASKAFAHEISEEEAQSLAARIDSFILTATRPPAQ